MRVVEVSQLGARNMTLIMWKCESSWEDETTQRPDYFSSVLQIYSVVLYVTLLFQATKDRSEENKQFKIIFNKARYVLLFEIHASNYMWKSSSL